MSNGSMEIHRTAGIQLLHLFIKGVVIFIIIKECFLRECSWLPTRRFSVTLEKLHLPEFYRRCCPDHCASRPVHGTSDNHGIN
jgi:hypothetical protein